MHSLYLAKAEGSALPSLAQKLLINEGDKEFVDRHEYEDTVKWLTGSLYLGTYSLLSYHVSPNGIVGSGSWG